MSQYTQWVIYYVIRSQLLLTAKDRETANITLFFLALASELAKVIDKLGKGSETKQKQCF